VCLAVERRKRVRAARTRFNDLGREALRSGTFLLAATDRLEGTTALLQAFKTALRGRIEYLRRRDSRWEAVAVMATLEIALFHDDNLPRLPAETRRVLQDVNFPEGECGGPVWLVHALVHVGEVEADEVRAVLSDLLPGHRRVMLRKLDDRRPVTEGVRRVVAYPHKPVLARRDPDADGGWSAYDDEELALYVAWAGGAEGRFAARRFWLGPTRRWLARRRGEAIEEVASAAARHDADDGGQSSGHDVRIS